MVLIWRKKNTWDIKVKIAVTVVFWIVFFIIGATGDNKDTKIEDGKVSETVDAISDSSINDNSNTLVDKEQNEADTIAIDKSEQAEAPTTPKVLEPKEMNSLQTLFASLNSLEIIYSLAMEL